MKALDRRLFERTRGARVVLVTDSALGVCAALLVLVQAVLLARVVARSFGGASLAELRVPLLLLIGVVCARATLTWAFESAGRRAAASVLSELRLSLVERRLRDAPTASDGVESAALAATAVRGVDALEAYFARFVPQLVLATVVPVTVLILVAAIDLVSAGLMVLTLALVPLFMVLVGRYTEHHVRRRWRELLLLETHFLDVVRGLPTLRAFNRGRVQAARIAETSEQYRRATMSTLRVSFLSGAVMELAATLGVALVAVTVGVRLAGGGIAFEPALTVLVLAPELYLPLRALGARYHEAADGLAVVDRLLEPVASRRAVGMVTPPDPRAVSVRLEGVSFAYPRREVAVLEAVDLELRPGETVALVGPSGSGKSTVAALVLALDQPTRGRVTAGGIDLSGCDPGAWRRQVAWVPQQPTLFHETVAANIRLGDPAAADERVRAAARSAGADAFVTLLPDGYQTVVGDGGRPVSAGERRRLAIARAFLRDASLVVLDEPTADLDPESSAAVGDAVARLSAGRTVLLIAHRPELVAVADRVVRLEAGRVVSEQSPLTAGAT